MSTEIRYPFTNTPRPIAQIRLGAYEDGILVKTIPCYTEAEAKACGDALEAQGYEIRIRMGAKLPESIEGENE